MASPALLPAILYTDYVTAEFAAESKHEFVEGHVLAMAGGTAEHAALVAAITVQLGSQLRGKSCRVYSSDLRIRMQEVDVACYPDVTVVCGAIVHDVQDRYCATNPTVIVEVLSTSTEAYDRGNKFAFYRTIKTLQQYILVSQDKALVERFVRNADTSWTLTAFGPGSNVDVAAIQCEIIVDDLYEGLTLGQ
ncbi:MAG: Uma2 family endonuclease [Kofleriaceae bacterium]|nr:Uma2 family endonuclease [Kofleriaceae bacterium]